MVTLALNILPGIVEHGEFCGLDSGEKGVALEQEKIIETR